MNKRLRNGDMLKNQQKQLFTKRKISYSVWMDIFFGTRAEQSIIFGMITEVEEQNCRSFFGMR